MKLATTALFCLLLAGSARGGSGSPCIRDVDVAAAGWTTVGIGDLLARCGPGLEVRGPQGERVPQVEPPTSTPEISQDREIEVADESPACRDRDRTTVCRLPPLASGAALVGLTIELATLGTTAYRLYETSDRRPLELAEGRWVPGRTGSFQVHQFVAKKALLELYGPRRPPAVRRLRYHLRIAHDPAEIRFQAPRAGRYRLLLGREEEHGQARRASLPFVARSFRVRAPGAAGGQVVRLEIPDWIYRDPLRYDFWGTLRLKSGGEWLPFENLWSEGTVAAGELKGLVPQPTSWHAASRIDVPLSLPGLPLTALQLTAASWSAPFNRGVVVTTGAGDLRRGRQWPWACVPRPPLPCRLDVEIDPADSSSLHVTFADGDNPPLAAIDVTLWRHRQALAFRWPGGQPVWLEAGETPRGYPQPVELGLGPSPRPGLGDQPWLPAFLDAEPRAIPPWPLLAALGLASGLLLRIIWRLAYRKVGP